MSNTWVGGERERGGIIGLEVMGYGWGLGDKGLHGPKNKYCG